MAPSDLAGKWQHESTENFETYMEKVGMPEERRKVAAQNEPVLEVVIHGDQVDLTSGKWKQSFTIGTPFQQSFPGGLVLQSDASWEGDKLVIKAQDKNASTTRQVIGDQLVAVMDYEGVVCTRHFKRC